MVSHRKFYEVVRWKSELPQLHDNKQGMFTADALAPHFTRASGLWVSSASGHGLPCRLHSTDSICTCSGVCCKIIFFFSLCCEINHMIDIITLDGMQQKI